MAEPELERLAKALGPNRNDVRHLLDVAARSADGARIAKTVFRARLRQAGMNPDDQAAFPMVLELPPGMFRVGHVLNGDVEGPLFALPQGSTANIAHTAVVGETRRGKTYVLLSISRQHIEAGGRCWIVDPEDEYDVLARVITGPTKPLVLCPRHLRFNIFEPPADAIPWKTWLEDLCLLLRQEMFLRDGSVNLFDSEMRRLIEGKGLAGGQPQFPSLAETLEHFSNLKLGGAKARGGTWLESLTNRLGMLCNVFEDTARVTGSDMLRQLARRPVIFRLRGLRGLPLQFLVNFCITWLARYQEVTPAVMVFMIVLEEFHLMTADPARADIGRPTLCTQVATAGKRGIRFVFSNQLLSTFPDDILGNLACRVVMRLSNPKCLWVAQRSLGLTPEQATKIPELAFREAIVQYGDYPAPFKIRVDELSFPPPPDEAALEEAAREFLAQVAWTEDAEVHPPEPDLAITGDALKVFIRTAENSAELITERCDALEMDRAQEVRARKHLEAKGFITAVEQTLGNRLKFYELTAKGIEWARRNHIKVKQYKSSPLHEFILNHVEKAIGVLSSKFSFQRHSEIAREHGLEPDSVLNLPGGQRVIIEICCNNMPYEARNLVRETQVDGVDMVLAVTPNLRLKETLSEAVKKCETETAADRARARPLILLDAGECLDETFDWASAVLERPL